MKNILSSILDTTKKKAGAALLCTGLIATLSAGTALASGSPSSLLVKMQNGVGSFSTDQGKTWSQNAPEGVTVNDQDG